MVVVVPSPENLLALLAADFTSEPMALRRRSCCSRNRSYEFDVFDDCDAVLCYARGMQLALDRNEATHRAQGHRRGLVDGVHGFGDCLH